MSNNKNVKPNFHFLSDEALKKLRKDRFKHLSIAEALKDIVLNCPLPFTIGLFGKWGTGKSTIANFLKFKLSSEKDKIAIVGFDVWKYEKDSLRRQFLLTLEKQLKAQKVLDKNYLLNPRITASTSRGFEGKIKISKEKLSQFGIYVGAILLALALSIIGFVIYQAAPQILPSYLLSLMTPLLTVVTVLALFQIGSQVITAETETIGFDRFKDPDEFEQEFENLIKVTEIDRVLIIFDNLDRTTHKRAVELLSTIKTFFEPKTKKCVFLIQCDEEAIKKHLDSIYLKSRNKEEIDKIFDADEFLRKFFNTTIKIPPFIDADLEEYTERLLKETNLKAFDNNPDLVTVITQAFRENPRQIKQFINTLIAHYLVALERESEDGPIIPSGTITQNVAFLAKFLIIRQEFPSFYKTIIEDPKNLESFPNNPVRLRDFMNGTRIVKTDNARAFIYFKQPARYLALPGGVGEDLEIAFEDNKKDNAIKILSEIRGKGVAASVIANFIQELLVRNSDKQQNLINIINLTAQAKKSLNVEFTRKFYEDLAKFIREKIRYKIYTLDFDFIIPLLKEIRPVYREPIVSQYVDILASPKDSALAKEIPDYLNFKVKLAKYINDNRDLFKSQKENIRSALTNVCFDSLGVLSAFQEDESSIKVFITSGVLNRFIPTIQNADLGIKLDDKEALFTKKVNFILKCKKIIDHSVIGTLLDKFNALLNVQIQTPQSPEKESAILDILNKVEIILREYSGLIQDKSKVDLLSDLLIQANNIFGTWQQKSLFLPSLFYLKSAVNDAKIAPIEQVIQVFAQNAEPKTIEKFLTSQDKKTQQLMFTTMRTSLETRSLQDKGILDITWKFEGAEEKQNLLENLIRSDNYISALNKLDEEKYTVQNNKTIVELLLTKAVEIQIPQREPVYSAINQMRCANDQELRKKYIEQLKGMIIEQDSTSQESAYNAYKGAVKFLASPLKLQFSVEIVEWLNSIDPISSNYKFALRAVILSWSQLSVTHKDNVANIIFDKWIAKNTSVEEINMGFDILYEIKPRYNNYKPHFEILLTRLEGEQNKDVKKAILVGLQKIKTRSTKLSKPFWDKIDKLSKSQK